jgi:superfamily I DNA and/or RNA helicase
MPARLNTTEILGLCRAAQCFTATCSATQGVPNPTAFIITFYNKQRDLLQSLLEQRLPGPAAAGRVQALSVDAAQGSEADLVVLSPVRTSTARLSAFFKDARRINVAVSRAKHLCVVVGSRKMAAGAGGVWAGVLRHYAAGGGG